MEIREDKMVNAIDAIAIKMANYKALISGESLFAISISVSYIYVLAVILFDIMKFLAAFIMALFSIQSCQTKDEQNKQLKSIIANCDELDIIYCTKDTFTYRTKDPSTIGVFTELISNQSEVNEVFVDTCETTQKLIYKAKEQQVFTADISIAGGKDGISCNYVLYFTDSKMYRNRLTYRAGMAIDQIYSHRMK